MKVAVFVPTFNRQHAEALKAFAMGVLSCGDQVDYLNVDNGYRECDVAVVFGIRKEAVAASYSRGKIIAEHHKRGKRVVVLDTGYVKRDRYFMVGFDGLNGRADFRNQNSPGDRWKNLGVELKPWKAERGDNIIVAGQIPHDAACQHIDFRGWVKSAIAELQRRTKRPVVFRPHPLFGDPAGYGVIGVEISTRPLKDDLENAWGVVTFNSNTAVDAAIAGIPIWAFDRGSMALRIANHNLDDLGSPLTPDRTGWAHDLAYCQWNAQEMASGAAWRHLRDGAFERLAA
jgi:hypothetical protein